jgi:hypothetical protein
MLKSKLCTAGYLEGNSANEIAAVLSALLTAAYVKNEMFPVFLQPKGKEFHFCRSVT